MWRRSPVTGERLRNVCALNAARCNATVRPSALDHGAISDGVWGHLWSIRPDDGAPQRDYRCANEAETFTCDGGMSPQRLCTQRATF